MNRGLRGLKLFFNNKNKTWCLAYPRTPLAGGQSAYDLVTLQKIRARELIACRVGRRYNITDMNDTRESQMHNQQSKQQFRLSLKWKIAFISSFVIIGVITIVMVPIRHDLRVLVFGTLALVVGSALLGWTEERKEGILWKCLRVILGSIILAAGGLLITHGWNLRDNYLNDRARLIAMAAELKLNRMRIDLLSLSYDEYKSTNNPEEMTALSLPSTHQVRDVLSFSDIQKNDANFADMVFAYVFAADLLNSKLVQIDRVCSNHIASREMVKGIIQSTFGEECIFDVFRNLHKKLAGHLVTKYDWCYEEADIKLRKPIVDSVYLSIAKRYIQLNTRDHQRRMKQVRDILQQQSKLIPIPIEDSNTQTAMDPNN